MERDGSGGGKRRWKCTAQWWLCVQLRVMWLMTSKKKKRSMKFAQQHHVICDLILITVFNIGFVPAQCAHWQIGSCSLDLSDIWNEKDTNSEQDWDYILVWRQSVRSSGWKQSWCWDSHNQINSTWLQFQNAVVLKSHNPFVTKTCDSVSNKVNTWQCKSHYGDDISNTKKGKAE